MAISDRLNIANKIIQQQSELIVLFDRWVQFVKLNDLESAKETKDKANVLRVEIKELKKQYEKLNKRSGIILLN